MDHDDPLYPYRVVRNQEELDALDLEPGAVVIDAEHDVLVWRYNLVHNDMRWYMAGVDYTWRSVSTPAIVLVHGWGPDDYPEDWEQLGGEAL